MQVSMLAVFVAVNSCVHTSGLWKAAMCQTVLVFQRCFLAHHCCCFNVLSPPSLLSYVLFTPILHCCCRCCCSSCEHLFLLLPLSLRRLLLPLLLLPGLASRVPTVHSILLSAVMGPLGLLSHQITKVNTRV